MHRDLKLENILINFPDVDLWSLSEMQVIDFIRTIDLTGIRFEIKIADLGFAKQVNNIDSFA